MKYSTRPFGCIVPHEDLRDLLSTVEKPGRYVGGEYGAVNNPPGEGDFKICVIFPDLYEIGMSNQAVRILYKLFNDIRGLHAERAFSPATDFSKGLEEREVPLYSLENGIPVRYFQLLAFTVGYELAFTNVLGLLKSAGVPIERDDRGEEDPLVIAGGPAMTNPVPWSDILDAVFIGEAEGTVGKTLLELKELRDSGADRRALLNHLASSDGFWTPGSQAKRVSWQGFGNENNTPATLPIPSMVTVQDHGVIEIMRGCPNKCRFCHAGVFYRPFRQKSVSRIMDEARYLVEDCGYRDITLSSLSTGDYHGLEPLVKRLNQIYAHRHVSFSLPSLRVNSITLSLIGQLGVVRKSGLTFAVETPTRTGQMGINKEVPADRVIDILHEAKSLGWKLAKFYFMIGLPVDNGEDECLAIVDYLIEVQRKTGMNLNVNLGTFIPKPHTPFERAPQLTDSEAIDKIRRIRDGLRANKRIKFSFQSPYVSFLEGVLSRGDERAGHLAQQAWLNGASFDAWDDLMDKDAWRRAISEADWNVEEEICRSREDDSNLPWEDISLSVTDAHLRTESAKGRAGILTEPCAGQCLDHCGVCSKDCRVVVPDQDLFITTDIDAPPDNAVQAEQRNWRRLLIIFHKFGPAMYLGHLDLMNVLERSLQRSGISIDFTQGFNPKPRIEFAQPLSLGVSSKGEVGTIKVDYQGQTAKDLAERINLALPSGLTISDASWIAPPAEGRKTRKVMSAFWGSDWRLIPLTDTISPTARELRQALESECLERGVSDDCHIEYVGKGLNIRLRHGGTKNHNIMRLLESVLGMSVLKTPWTVVRERCWAAGSDGKPVLFAEAFPDAD
ncbi:MAG: TIGR03936 family radical SAM-associated protein [Spirochaetaceae bacterium]|nr:TIGR03936 family radical SAM-associated protein [Spirochaetaceae bacterium]